MVLRILLTIISLSPVVYITTSRFEVKCESGCTGDIRDTGFIPGLGRSHGEENGYPLQFSFLEKSMEKQSEGLQPIGLQELEIT